MSLLINGELKDNWLDAELDEGEFIREDSQFRHWITVDGSPGCSGKGGFPAEPGRYHLYVSYACPWAHRTLIFRTLKKLGDIITVSVVNPHMGLQGWDFSEYPGSTADSVNDFRYLHQVYTLAQPDYTGIITVPVLWDKQRQTIVNNESSEIIRMFNGAFQDYTDVGYDYYPPDLREEIDQINGVVYDNVNNGVYRCGFAGTQQAYEEAFDRLFATLQELEERLSSQAYLAGDRITEADWRLFTTLLRFDPVYYIHFKTNLRRISDYPNLFAYLCELYQKPGIRDTVNFDHIKRHYYASHTHLNPSGIIPKGPLLDLDASHGR